MTSNQKQAVVSGWHNRLQNENSWESDQRGVVGDVVMNRPALQAEISRNWYLNMTHKTHPKVMKANVTEMRITFQTNHETIK